MQSIQRIDTRERDFTIIVGLSDRKGVLLEQIIKYSESKHLCRQAPFVFCTFKERKKYTRIQKILFVDDADIIGWKFTATSL